MPEIQVKDKLITLEELGTAINAKAGVTSVNNQTGAVSITPANIGAVSANDVIGVAHGGTGATTPDEARANLSALRAFPASLSFGGSATNFYQNLGAQISTMADYEARLFIVYADVTSESFYQGHIYSGTIMRYANATCGGILTDQFGVSIAIGCENGVWSARSL